MFVPSRRGLITGLISLVAAPAIVRAESIMPIKVWKPASAAPGLYIYGVSDFGSKLHEFVPEERLGSNMLGVLYGIPLSHGLIRRVHSDGNDVTSMFGVNRVHDSIEMQVSNQELMRDMMRQWRQEILA